MSTMDSADTTFHGPGASVRTYLTADVVTVLPPRPVVPRP